MAAKLKNVEYDRNLLADYVEEYEHQRKFYHINDCLKPRHLKKALKKRAAGRKLTGYETAMTTNEPLYDMDGSYLHWD